MTIHLTDDEIVAVCGLLELAWPYPLPTVPADSTTLEAASRRGLRSLTVRALLGVDPDTDQPGLNEGVANAVSNLVAGSPLLVSGVIDAEGALMPSGSAAYVVKVPDGSGLLVTTTATGIHVFTSSSVAEAREAFIALVDNALTVGIGGADNARLLVLKAGEPERALAVSKGKVTVGRIDQDAAFTESGEDRSDWKIASLSNLLAP